MVAFDRVRRLVWRTMMMIGTRCMEWSLESGNRELRASGMASAFGFPSSSTFTDNKVCPGE